MRHSITFTDMTTGESRNTWSNWGIVPVRQPVFSPPPVKTKILEVPGGNGELDLSEAITGYPVYGNRQGSFSFLSPDRWTEWLPLYGQIADFLHGQTMRVKLEDDPGWYYEGRFSINETACDELHGVIALDYSVGPFKWAITATNEPWLWDPFSFVDGVIYDGTYRDPEVFLRTRTLVSTSDTPLTFTAEETGYTPLQPTFTNESETVSITLFFTVGIETFSVALAANTSMGVPGLMMKHGVWTYNGQETTVSAQTDDGQTLIKVEFYAQYQGGDVSQHIEVTTTVAELALSAAETGSAPLQPHFLATGANVTLYLEDTSGPTAVATLTAGTPKTLPGIVLYKGRWLYNGQTRKMYAATASGTANLALVFRPGRL